MSHLLDRLTFFKRKSEPFSENHGITTDENREWEDAYRKRWQHDKIVRSTHGNNCTGSCSWKIYVKNGLVTWETQQTDYPRTRPDLPNHEPRGCQRGASFSWHLYSQARLKYPLIRTSLWRLWTDAKQQYRSPVEAWAAIMTDHDKRKSFQQERGMGGFIRASWDELTEIVAAANLYTAKTYGPDRIVGFSPIPAMSMVSFAAGTRYLSLIGGTCLSFYDWYCDLPPSSPQIWGEQTDVPESADWYNSNFIITWGSNVPQTRTPDAHFLSEARYKGTKVVAVTPDYAEVAKFADNWLNPKQGTDAALALAMGHVILSEFFVKNATPYFQKYCQQYSDMPFLVVLERNAQGLLVSGRMLRASEFADNLNINPESAAHTPVVIDQISGNIVAPNGTIGSRWDKSAKWNLELKNAVNGSEISPLLSCAETSDYQLSEVAFPYFGNLEHEYFAATTHDSIITHQVPCRKLQINGQELFVTTVYDLFLANYGVDRGFDDLNAASDYYQDKPYSPQWQEKITGVTANKVIDIARQFADNASKTEGRSMVIVGAGLNHWYNMDMTYRAIINLLVMCGCIGKSGGGWCHYVGQEKLRPQSGWQQLATATDWSRPPRLMNGTSFFYAHTNQWRYEKLGLGEVISPLANHEEWADKSIIDCNVMAEQRGWLPTAPQLQANPLTIGAQIKASNANPSEYIASQFTNGNLTMACQDPDNPQNWPRNLFVWRSNLLGASGKGHEYFLKHLLGTSNGVQGKDLGAQGKHPAKVIWHDAAPEGKLDLLVTLDFRMSSTCLYSDIVFPTASWYEKNDLNTSDMHPFIHPFTKAVDPVWESRNDWEIYKALAAKISQLAHGNLETVHDVVLTPILHDSPAENGQGLVIKDWTREECLPIANLTMPNVTLVERDYRQIYSKYTSLGPLVETLGVGSKGINWLADEEIELLKQLNYTTTNGKVKIDSDIDACEVILSLSPETSGEVALKSWQALEKFTGRKHTHLVEAREDEKIRYRDVQAQPRKIITSPTWSGIESEHVSYTFSYTNVHELIPWRTLSGRQELYQDHPWMRAFGEEHCVYKPPVNTKSVESIIDAKEKHVVLNFLTPHQKWGIHSTHSDNLLMLTLSRGGPNVWISEDDAKLIDVEDNDWVEAYNENGSIAARAIVSQRIPQGVIMMYHAQDKVINAPLSEKTGLRGGVHNSVTRITMKPTHMIGGYHQLAYGWNYYGTVGSNRDEFIVLRKMKNIAWGNTYAPEETPFTAK